MKKPRKFSAEAIATFRRMTQAEKLGNGQRSSIPTQNARPVLIRCMKRASVIEN